MFKKFLIIAETLMIELRTLSRESQEIIELARTKISVMITQYSK